MNGLVKRKIITIYLFIYMAAFAMTHTMFGILLPRMIHSYSLSLSQAGLLALFMGGGGLLSMMITGLIGDHGRKHVIIGFAFFVLSLSMLIVSTMPNFTSLVASFSVIGMCSSMLNLLISAYVSDLYGPQRTRYMSLLHVFFGIGSLLGPLFPSLIAKYGYNWNYTYRFMASSFLIVLISYCFVMKILDDKKNNVNRIIEKREMLPITNIIRYPGVIMLCLMSFMYMGGHQAAFSVWLPTYLNSQNAIVYTVSFTGMIMTIYWLGIVGGRLISSVLTLHVQARTFIVVGSIIGTIIQIISLSINLPVLWIISVLILGLATGAIYPLTMAIGCEWFPKNSASVSSFVGLFSSLGNMFWLWLIGQIAEKLNFTFAMVFPIASLAIVFIVSSIGLKGKM